MSVFVLVHGSFLGGWCWEAVIPLLERAGHRVLAPDMPGHGADRTPWAELGYDRYVDRIHEVLAAQSEPAILVGHSMGGTLVTGAAEREPDRIRRLIYVCAFLPSDGQSLLDLAMTDTESRLLPALIIDEAAGSHRVRPDAARAVLFHDCPAADAARAEARLIPEPLSVVSTPVRTSAARFGRVPRDYLLCTEDCALGPALQARMVEAQPCRVRTLASSHSPFYSMPEKLAALLVESL